MTDIVTDVTTNGQTIDITVYHDIGNTGTANNQESVTNLSDGETVYELSSINMSEGDSYWVDIDLSTTDTSTTPIVHSVFLLRTTLPITIGGSEVKEITIDGKVVKGLTIDGTTVF